MAEAMLAGMREAMISLAALDGALLLLLAPTAVAGAPTATATVPRRSVFLPVGETVGELGAAPVGAAAARGSPSLSHLL